MDWFTRAALQAFGRDARFLPGQTCAGDSMAVLRWSLSAPLSAVVKSLSAGLLPVEFSFLPPVRVFVAQRPLS